MKLYFNQLCDCVGVLAVCSFDIISGDIWVDKEQSDADPAASNNAYYNACLDYAYSYNQGANHVHETGAIQKWFGVGPCDEHGTAISQELWDKCYEYKDGKVTRRPGTSIDEEWAKFCSDLAKKQK